MGRQRHESSALVRFLTETPAEYLKRKLHEHKGDWQQISRASGVPYWTLANIAQGVVADPRVSTAEALIRYFDQRRA